MPSPMFDRAGSLRSGYEGVDWVAAGIGGAGSWPQELGNALNTILSTRFPACLFWGPDLVMLYNEAYVVLIADKHPGALGTPASRVFPEIWDAISPGLEGVYAGGAPTWTADERLLLYRRGFLEECYFTFSFSPVVGAGGAVLGVLAIAAETTAQVLDRRRLDLLSRLAHELRDLPDPALLAGRALPVLRTSPFDLRDVRIDRHPVSPSEPVAGGREFSVALVAGEALTVRLSDQLPPDPAYLDFVRLAAGTLREASVAAADGLADRSMSEALQRSLLTEPAQPDCCDIAVRYRPATSGTQVGGDWYDSFSALDGATYVVIGDVTGHDQDAAAIMGQVRNLLRGVSYSAAGSPAITLTAVDRAMRGLGVGRLVTALMAHVEPGRMTWSNAGHLPPLLINPDGMARPLDTRPELLLGVEPAAHRSDHTATLQPGSTVLLFTDGLVEQRGADLTDGLDRLAAVAARLATAPLDQLCDELLDQLGSSAEDDIAVLALRAR